MAKSKIGKKTRVVRIIVLLVILALSTAIGILHQFGKDWVPVSVDALCPFGGIESAFYFIYSGAMLNKIALSSFILLLALLVTALLFRRVFCGHICPLGTLQELASMLGKKILGKQPAIPVKIDRPFRFLKYIVLFAVVIFSTLSGELIIRPYDPWATWHHLFSADLFSEFLVGFIILILSLAGSFFFNRVFCKYLCPMGGFLGLINRIGFFRIERNNATCTHCKACDRICPVNIKIEQQEKINSSECLNCSLCVSTCPEKDTLVISGLKKIKLHPFPVIFISLAIFGGVITWTSVTGSFKWELETLKQTVEKKGDFNPDDIKGRDTFRQVSEASGVSPEMLMKHFNLTAGDFELPIRDVSANKNKAFETDDVRAFIREKMK